MAITLDCRYTDIVDNVVKHLNDYQVTQFLSLSKFVRARSKYRQHKWKVIIHRSDLVTTFMPSICKSFYIEMPISTNKIDGVFKLFPRTTTFEVNKYDVVITIPVYQNFMPLEQHYGHDYHFSKFLISRVSKYLVVMRQLAGIVTEDVEKAFSIAYNHAEIISGDSEMLYDPHTMTSFIDAVQRFLQHIADVVVQRREYTQ